MLKKLTLKLEIKVFYNFSCERVVKRKNVI